MKKRILNKQYLFLRISLLLSVTNQNSCGKALWPYLFLQDFSRYKQGYFYTYVRLQIMISTRWNPFYNNTFRRSSLRQYKKRNYFLKNFRKRQFTNFLILIGRLIIKTNFKFPNYLEIRQLKILLLVPSCYFLSV